MVLRQILCCLALCTSASGWAFCRQSACEQQGYQQWSKDPLQLGAIARRTKRPWGHKMNHTAFRTVESQWLQRPPMFKGVTVSLENVASFVVELLQTNPFGTPPNVPWMDLGASGDGKVAAVSQRQLAYIVANVLMGNTIPAGDGLTRILDGCMHKKKPEPQGYLMSLLSFLAVLSTELANGDQGKIVIAAGTGGRSNFWKGKLDDTMLQAPTICASDAGGDACDLGDFMKGGNEYQAVVDAAMNHIGGTSDFCDPGANQDDSMALFYSEVLAFHFFLGGEGKIQLPFSVLGARRYLGDISGQAGFGFPYYGRCGVVRLSNWLNQDISANAVQIQLNGQQEWIHPLAFVGLSSKEIAGCKVTDAVQNLCLEQRDQVDHDITLWYQAFDPSMYAEVIQPIFKMLVKRIGTGPWGAGNNFGDSQHAFLAAWLATALLGDKDVQFDYYVYSQFCENSGNQCYLMGTDKCDECLTKGTANQYPLPIERCSTASVTDMSLQFTNTQARELYNLLSQPQIISNVGMQLFDILATTGNSKMKIENPVAPNALGMFSHGRWSFKQGGQLMQKEGWCIDAQYPDKPGSTVHMWECINAENFLGQTWIYDAATKQIRNNKNLCFDAADPEKDLGDINNGMKIFLNPCDQPGHQRWIFNETTGQVINEDGKCIDAPLPGKNGNEVHMWQCFDKLPSQMWISKQPPGGAAQIKDSRGLCLGTSPEGKLYTARCETEKDKATFQGWDFHMDTGLLMQGTECLQAMDPMKVGSPVTLGECGTDPSKQMWIHNETTQTFQNSNGFCIDGPEPDADEHDDLYQVHLWSCFPSLSNQEFAKSDEKGLIRNRKGFCLDAMMPSLKGTEVRMQECKESSESQHWHLEQSTGLIKSQFGSCLAAHGPEDGAELRIAECDSTEQLQIWAYDDAKGRLKNSGGKCIDSPESNKKNGQVHMWECYENLDSQEWV